MSEATRVLLDYISTHHSKEIEELKQCNRQVRLNLDYICFNDYFTSKTGMGFFTFTNWKKILQIVEAEINNKNNTHINIKIVDVPPNTNLHDLDANYVGKVISCKSMVKNIAKTNPTLKKAVYECKSCMRLLPIHIKDNVIAEPTLCTECGGKTFRLNQELSEFRDYRYVKLEEPLEYRTGGTTVEFKGYMEDYLASPFHNLKVGDVVDIVGEFKVRKTDKNNKKNDFEFYIDLHDIKPVDNAFEDYRLTDEDKAEILKLSREPNIYERLVKSLAPEIVGYETVKEGLLLQLFEGYRPTDDIFKNATMDRWTSHILLIGDVGIGKSQIITALKRKAPKIIDINGADTTQAGLTTSAVKDELTGSWTLEAGALILADTGLLCIDEFDKLDKKTQKSLNQCMEQLSVSSTKAGLVQTMTARTSIIACANPKYSRFNPYKDTKEQINIPDSTLSRFDLVFALNDEINESKDTNLAKSLLNKSELLNDTDLIDESLFKKYITYAKLECFPKLTEEAKRLLINFYVTTRQSAKQNNSAKPITARDLKALERLTIERAKTELRNEATVEDGRCAIRIYCSALKTIGLSPETAGELQQVLSDAEIQIVNDAEKMILAQLKMNNTVDMNYIKHEIGVKCHEQKIKKNYLDIVEIAMKNVQKMEGEQ